MPSRSESTPLLSSFPFSAFVAVLLSVSLAHRGILLRGESHSENYVPSQKLLISFAVTNEQEKEGKERKGKSPPSMH